MNSCVHIKLISSRSLLFWHFSLNIFPVEIMPYLLNDAIKMDILIGMRYQLSENINKNTHVCWEGEIQKILHSKQILDAVLLVRHYNYTYQRQHYFLFLMMMHIICKPVNIYYLVYQSTVIIKKNVPYFFARRHWIIVYRWTHCPYYFLSYF